MAVIVQKYGGSSVADMQKLRLVADQVAAARRAGHEVVVVVSAMGKTTDQLLAQGREAALHEAAGEPARRELDMLVSTGERISMALLSIAIQARGLDAISFTGSQSGIITNDRHFDARIIEVRPHRIEDELSRGRIVIVAGYQGMSYRREITTLGRGGSDTTAVALAAALGAERCEIYSDVDGVYSADPRNVPDARHLPTLDYAVMQEMAEAGAKVLNAQAVEWARRNKVAIHARRTGDALRDEPFRETVVSTSPGAGELPRAVVVQPRVALCELAAATLPVFLSEAARLGVPLADLALADGRARALAPLANVPDWPAVRPALTGAVPELSVHEDHGAVSLVGVELGSRPEVVAAALGQCGAEPRWLVSSPLRITAVLPRDALPGVERAWHATLTAG